MEKELQYRLCGSHETRKQPVLLSDTWRDVRWKINSELKSQMLLDCFGPEHILAWAQEQDQPVYQDLAREVATAWGDPEAEGLPCCQAAVSLKPKATEVQGYIQAFGERAARWPEGLRPLLGDLVKILTQCNARRQTG